MGKMLKFPQYKYQATSQSLELLYVFKICFILTNNTSIWNSHSSGRDPKATRISNVVKDDGLSL